MWKKLWGNKKSESVDRAKKASLSETCLEALSSSGACGCTGCLRAFKRGLDRSSRCSEFGTAGVQWRRPVMGKCVWP